MGKVHVILETCIIFLSTIIWSLVFFHSHSATLHHSFIWKLYQSDIMITTLYLHSPQRRVAGMKLEPLYYMRSRTSVLVLGYSEDTSDFMRQNVGTVPVSCMLCARVGYQYTPVPRSIESSLIMRYLHYPFCTQIEKNDYLHGFPHSPSPQVFLDSM